MSGFGVQPDDMTRASVIDRKLDALLAGREPAAGDELAMELSLMLEGLDQAFPAVVVVSEQVEDAHLACMMEAAADLPAPATAPMAPVRQGVFARTRDGLSRKVAAATLALTTAFGGAAYAGVLPARVQGLVADAAAVVGLQLPRPGDDAAGEHAGTSDSGKRSDDDGIEITEGHADDDHRRPADAAGYAPGAGPDDQPSRVGDARDEDRARADDDPEWDDADDVDDERRSSSDDDEADDDEAEHDEADDEAELGDPADDSDDELEDSGDGERTRPYEGDDDEGDERVGGSSGDDSDSDDRDLEEGSDD